MTDSARTKQDETPTPAERPAWRFSGRRGTPVHLREQAPETLPPEIRKAVTQLAKERASEASTAVDARPARATSELKLSRPDTQAPPVAGAPLPVERRADREAAGSSVATSHIPAAAAPTPAIDLPDVAPAPVVESEAPSVVEPEAPSVVEAEAPQVAEVEAPQVVEVEAPPVAEAAIPNAGAAPEPAVEAGHAAPAAETESKPESTADSKAEPTAERAASETTAARPRLTAAERKKRAKARAKAKAKAQRAAKRDTAESKAAADKARRLFARGRDVDADAAATVEPTVAAEPAVISGATDPVEPTLPMEPAATTPEAGPAPKLDSRSEPDDQVRADASAPAEAPVDVTDLPDLVPSLEAIEETRTPAEPVETEPAVAETESPAPILATETAAQAAWELGRLPFLLTEPTTRDAADSPQSAPAEPTTIELDAHDAYPTPAPTWEPVSSIDLEPTPAAREQAVVLRPIDWLPVGSQPNPAPIEPIDLPRRPLPDSIERLQAPLEVPRSDSPRAGAREGMTPNARAAEARRRISRRRAELDDLVHTLAGLGSGRRD